MGQVNSKSQTSQLADAPIDNASTSGTSIGRPINTQKLHRRLETYVNRFIVETFGKSKYRNMYLKWVQRDPIIHQKFETWLEMKLSLYK